jgi:hypothetical protein
MSSMHYNIALWEWVRWNIIEGWICTWLFDQKGSGLIEIPQSKYLGILYRYNSLS